MLSALMCVCVCAFVRMVSSEWRVRPDLVVLEAGGLQERRHLLQDVVVPPSVRLCAQALQKKASADAVPATWMTMASETRSGRSSKHTHLTSRHARSAATVKRFEGAVFNGASRTDKGKSDIRAVQRGLGTRCHPMVGAESAPMWTIAACETDIDRKPWRPRMPRVGTTYVASSDEREDWGVGDRPLETKACAPDDKCPRFDAGAWKATATSENHTA